MPRPSSTTSARDRAPSDAAPGREQTPEAFVAEVLAAAPAEPLAPPPAFLEAAAELGIAFEVDDLERLGRFLALLLHANTAMNLTAIRDAGEAWHKHVLDALTLLAPLADLPAGARVIDVGTGGGVPGIPLAIARPDLAVTLLDATAKKAAFARAAADVLGVERAAVLAGRCEALARDAAHRDAYAAAVARALGPLPTAAELVLPFVQPGGLAVFIKGQRADEELAQAKHALHALHAAHAGTIDTPTGRLVVLEKLRATPGAYPRANGEPKRRPLGSEPGRSGA
ncbi:MAG: 16S rRNA (guanine(527)-N(7))-methyltransferase RsmG [Planctomycetota bacterium]